MPNHLDRDFRQGIPGKVLLTDITYIAQPSGKWACLSTIKDATTDQLLVHNLSRSLEMPLVTDTLEKLKATGMTFPEGALIPSDQGGHYASPIFQNIVKSWDSGSPCPAGETAGTMHLRNPSTVISRMKWTSGPAGPSFYST